MRFFAANSRRSFHGVHPPPAKGPTRNARIHRLPFAPLFTVPLAQHAGKPAVPVVAEGDIVARGQLLGRADGELSVPVHAPATGTVRRIAPVASVAGTMVPGVYVESQPGSTQEVAEGTPCPVETAAPGDILTAVQAAGIVGLGGAAFPTHVKLRLPVGTRVDTLIVNGAECEPYLTTDYRVMLEQADDIVLGVRYVLKATGAARAVLAVETHSRDALPGIQDAIARAAEPRPPLDTVSLDVKYPQGAEKVLIRTLLGREVPSGRLPFEAGALCINVATVAEIGRLLPHGRGIVERVVTFAGDGITRPGNYRVPIGTPLRFALDHVGLTREARRVLLGGPMMGHSTATLDVPITKGIPGIIALTTGTPPTVYPCIHCGRCVDVCPMGLNPAELGVLARAGEFIRMHDGFHLADCFECGACAFVCPAHLPLVQEFQAAKASLARTGA